VRSVRHILFFPRGLFGSPRRYFQSVEMLSAKECQRVVRAHFELGTAIYSVVAVVVAVLLFFFPPPPEADSPGVLFMGFFGMIFAGFLLSLFFFYSMSAAVWLVLRRSRCEARDVWGVARTAVAQTAVVNRLYLLVPLYVVLQVVMLGYAIRGARVLGGCARDGG